MTIAVDTNVLLDVLTSDPTFAQSSERALFDAIRAGGVVLCETVYAELVPNFDAEAGLDDFLARTGISLRPSSRRALFIAGEAWQRYLANSDRGVQCPACGASQNFVCSGCGRPLRFRQHIISDFLIGGHAAVHAGSLLTRDPRYYRTYFPDLSLV